ncbi:hypothetical protein CGMCC3_g9865 [Colletotrichum fructicola]|nr:uncharacterized protein CGMCC3_g9865 [Colletotrichum fructicola]KAE9574181.1 hypothetical protein CGMCC3_g9865 [Colletotrichum fructicola]KAF4430851.1 hypothetical protein CFRS1_v009592 [Colletotrichum fructicola]
MANFPVEHCLTFPQGRCFDRPITIEEFYVFEKFGILEHVRDQWHRVGFCEIREFEDDAYNYWVLTGGKYIAYPVPRSIFKDAFRQYQEENNRKRKEKRLKELPIREFMVAKDENVAWLDPLPQGYIDWAKAGGMGQPK